MDIRRNGQIEVCMAELVQPLITGADLDYQGSITIDNNFLGNSGLLPGQMVYVDNVDRLSPSWRTYIVPGEYGKGEIIMNGPPAYHFKRGDRVTIRGSAFILQKHQPEVLKEGHTRLYFSRNEDGSNRLTHSDLHTLFDNHYRQACISKLHRIVLTGTSPEGYERLVVDEDILDRAGFPVGIEVQFTSLADGALRRTCMQAGPRGSGIAEIHGAGAQYVAPGTRIITLAETLLSYEDARTVTGPQVAFFDETRNDRNIIREVKPSGYAPRKRLRIR